MKQRRLNLKRRELPTITLTPLIDTVLVLLIIFMVTSPTKAPIEVAKAELKPDTSIKAVVVIIDAQGRISIDGSFVKDTEFLKQLEKRLKGLPFKVVRLHAQQGASGALVHKVLDTARGIHGVKLAFW